MPISSIELNCPQSWKFPSRQNDNGEVSEVAQKVSRSYLIGNKFAFLGVLKYPMIWAPIIEFSVDWHKQCWLNAWMCHPKWGNTEWVLWKYTCALTQCKHALSQCKAALTQCCLFWVSAFGISMSDFHVFVWSVQFFKSTRFEILGVLHLWICTNSKILTTLASTVRHT